jgi:hypothetical protein
MAVICAVLNTLGDCLELMGEAGIRLGARLCDAGRYLINICGKNAE